ncbi:uncharacterized protein LOC143880214 isoform X2 [Tasmannia lanceolata]|uniref:uncharacterized protein LOC143880214 isoform X2 n=1 Tax=Tasmannia lanceolata TaxID=3420 RepID=UPI0040638686
MGSLQVWPPQANGILVEEIPSPSRSLSSSSNPNPLSIGVEIWQIAEQKTREIISQIQPTVVSEQRRKAVVDYVQRLIRSFLGSEVFPFGSVPLKTYLPDGDIDLTAVSNLNVEDALANDVCSVLEGEEQNKAAEFEVKDVQYIHAEVKLVKCLVQNIVVDISFNQLGGLCTLCFLEKVDLFIGKDHLFKRSIILIKAWCYYESRILGAHHGLISTYALETLVLYIFHLFHSSLNGPLAVLYRFLDYFSKFDWDNYCISLNGPVPVSSLPEIVAETPETDGADLLLTKDFLRVCVDLFAVPSRGNVNNSRSFPQKHLNIIDPLKENNNLGRSVSKGNFYRIRSAFTYGARKLGRILVLPGESIVDELNKFFMNTLDRHGGGQRPDVQDLAPSYLFDINGSGSISLKTDAEKCTDGNTIVGSPSISSSSPIGETTADHYGVLSEEINNLNISHSEWKHETGMQTVGQSSNHQPTRDEPQKLEGSSSLSVSESDCLTEGNVVSGSRMAGDAKDLASNRVLGSKITNDIHMPFLNTSEPGTWSFERAHHAPHLFYSNQFPENGRIGNGTLDQTKFIAGLLENNLSFRLQAPKGEIGFVLQPDHDECDSTSNITFRSESDHSSFLESSSNSISDVGWRERDSIGTAGSSENLNGLSDLSGDYDTLFNSLLYCQHCHEYILCGPVIPIPSASHSQFRSKPSFGALRQPAHLKRNMFPHMSANGAVPGSQFFLPAYYTEEMPKPRGTGTYIPNMAHSFQAVGILEPSFIQGEALTR